MVHPYAICFMVSRAAGFIPNTILLILIIFATPPKSWDFAIIIANQTIALLISTTAEFLLCPGFTPVPFNIMFTVYGPANNWSHEVVCHIFATMLSSIYHCIAATSLPFIHRLWVVQNKKYSPNKTFFLCAGSSVPYIIQYVGIYYFSTNAINLDKLYMDNYDWEHRETTIVGFNVDGTIWASVFALSSTFFTLLVVEYCKRRINIILDVSSFEMSELSRRMHRRLLKAFILQANVPAVMTISTILMYTEFFGVYHHWSFEYITWSFGVIVTIDQPVISIEFITFYRNGFLRLFPCIPKKPQTTTVPRNTQASSTAVRQR